MRDIYIFSAKLLLPNAVIVHVNSYVNTFFMIFNINNINVSS